MTTVRKVAAHQLPDPDFVHPEVIAPETGMGRAFRYVFAITRLSLGWIFLWSFLDKTFALGFSTGRDPETGVVDRFGDAAWINGGSPTEGFLTFGTKGPFADTFQTIAGAGWANWMYMLGMLGIGLSLLFGVAMRLAAGSGVLMMLLIYGAQLWPSTNPFMDSHLIYALVLVSLVLAQAGHTLGFGGRWEDLRIVARNGWLK